MDEGFGRDTVLLDRIAGAGLYYLAEVPHDTRVWAARPATARRPLGTCPPPPRACAWWTHRPCPSGWTPWRPRCRRMPGGWCVSRRAARDRCGCRWLPCGWWPCGTGCPVRTSGWCCAAAWTPTPSSRPICPTPRPTRRPATLVWLLGRRWPIELAIREAKDELGMDHYEVRGWRGWHHHLTMTLLAQHFLVWQRARLGEKITGPDRAPGPAAARGDPAPAPARRRHRAPTGSAISSTRITPPPRPSPPPAPPRLLLAI